MKLSQALENEIARNDKNKWNVCYLHKDGKFYHAYEWSAWLIKTVSCTEEYQKQRGDAKMLSAKRYKTKGRDYVMLGFPVESISKYVPEYVALDTLGDDLAITLECEFADDFSYDKLTESLNKWSSGLAFVENKTKSVAEIAKGDSRAAVLGKSGLFHIITRILSYPVENSTPSENIAFISEIKQEIVGML